MTTADALDRLHREHAARLLALLVRELRDFDAAEEALQEAWLAAQRQWPADGVPANPAAWLLTVARRRARDDQRRAATLARKLPLLVVEARERDAEDDTAPDEPVDEDDVIPDERLRLIFTSCHPTLARPTQLALTLRFVAGLSTREIARLLLISEATMAARITRAKRKIAVAGIPYRVPRDADLPERLTSVLTVIYLLFTEGYAPTRGESVVRPQLCDEAIRLGRLLRELMPDEREATALLALMLLQHARRTARVGADGALVLLADQDRARWGQDEIGEGLALAAAAVRGSDASGSYAIEAAIAALHSVAPSADATDWTAIAKLYGRLAQVKPSPAVALARAVAVAEAEGPDAGLALLEAPGAPGAAMAAGHQPHAVRGELLLRAGRSAEAVAAFDAALAAVADGPVREHLAARRAAAARLATVD